MFTLFLCRVFSLSGPAYPPQHGSRVTGQEAESMITISSGRTKAPNMTFGSGLNQRLSFSLTEVAPIWPPF